LGWEEIKSWIALENNPDVLLPCVTLVLVVLRPVVTLVCEVLLLLISVPFV
jgi:hypothetical protein